MQTLLTPHSDTAQADEVSLRKYTHDREASGDHGTAATGEVSLRKDTHDRESGSDHGTVATGEVSLRKYSHDRESGGDHAAATTGEVSLRKDTHDRESGGDHAAVSTNERPAPAPQAASAHDRHEAGEEIPTVDDAAIVTLSARERATLVELGVKLEQWLDDPAQLAPTDWEILAPIALRFRELLQRLSESGTHG